jgi:hypothetical protein
LRYSTLSMFCFCFLKKSSPDEKVLNLVAGRKRHCRIEMKKPADV